MCKLKILYPKINSIHITITKEHFLTALMEHCYFNLTYLKKKGYFVA